MTNRTMERYDLDYETKIEMLKEKLKDSRKETLEEVKIILKEFYRKIPANIFLNDAIEELFQDIDKLKEKEK
jgi:hypothetical protein